MINELTKGRDLGKMNCVFKQVCLQHSSPVLPSAELTHRSCVCSPSLCPEHCWTEVKTPDSKVFFFHLNRKHRQISANDSVHCFLLLGYCKVCDRCYQAWVDIWKSTLFLVDLLHCTMSWWKSGEWTKSAFLHLFFLSGLFFISDYSDGITTCLSFSKILQHFSNGKLI